MKARGNKILLLAFALQVLMLFSIMALVYGVSEKGGTVILEMTGYDPYDALRGRYIRLNPPVNLVTLEPDSVERYLTRRGNQSYVYVILEKEPDSSVSRFSYASLDRPDKGVPYIKCKAGELWTAGEESQLKIYPRISQYYLNERQAERLDDSIRWDTEIRLSLKIWHGMYVIDGIEVDGQTY